MVPLVTDPLGERFHLRLILFLVAHSQLAPGVPFGGFKQSGLGREGSLEELLSLLRLRASIYD